MKRLSILVAALVAALAFPAPGGEPGESARAFLEVLQAGETAPLDLLEQTMISPFCGVAKRTEIVERLERTGRMLRRGEFALEVADEKVEGDFASVLVAATSKLDPLEVEIFALGTGKVDGKWLPAPVPGSFENSRVGFDEDLRRRVDALGLWMSRERVDRLRRLQADTERAFQERIDKALPGLNLEGAKPKAVVEAFLRSCGKADLPATMALLGQVVAERDEKDRELLRVVSRGLLAQDRRKYWRLVTSPDVVRVLIEEDGGDDLDAEVVLLAQEAVGGGSAKLLRFVLLRVDGRWEIELPRSLLLADADESRFQQAIWREHDPDDSDMQKNFASFFESATEPLLSPSLEEAGKRIASIVDDGKLGDLYRMLHRDDELTDRERSVAYAELGQFWGNFRRGGKNAAAGDLIGTIQRNKAGVLVYHVVATAQLGRVTLKTLHMIEGPDGWAIAPGVSGVRNFKAIDEGLKADLEAAEKEFQSQEEALSEKASKVFLERFVEARPKAGATLDPAEAGALVKRFREDLRSGRLLESFESCALLDFEDGAWDALEALHYEYRGARHGNIPDRELGVASEGPWSAVSLRVDSGPSGVPDYPMYLVVATESGPRIVVDAGLRLAVNKARDQLNKEVWKHIESRIDASEVGLVRKLFQAHVERTKPDHEEWQKSSKSSP